MKSFILVASFFICSTSFACECIKDILVHNFQKSAFVAKIKILKVSAPTADGEYQDANIEVLELYKGKKIRTIKIQASLNTDCNLMVDENTDWLVFAQINRSGILQFDLCSGSMQLDRKMNSIDYPNAQTNYIKEINNKIAVLQFFKLKHITDLNEYDLHLKYNERLHDLFKGYEGESQKNAVYQLTVEKDLSISKIKALKEFDNQKLSKALLAYLKEKAKLNTRNISAIKKRTKLIVVYYFYPAEKEYQSFISEFD
ncbi:MAG: hypothetical protein WCL56_12185 [Sediminibacterium sp.]